MVDKKITALTDNPAGIVSVDLLHVIDDPWNGNQQKDFNATLLIIYSFIGFLTQWKIYLTIHKLQSQYQLFDITTNCWIKRNYALMEQL